MKKKLSLICVLVLIASIAVPLASCSRKIKPVSDKFNGLYAAEESGANDAISFSEGVYKEDYNGNTYTGTYSSYGGKLYLSPYGKKFQYVFTIELNEKGDVARFFNENRSFSVEKSKKK